MLLSRPFCFVLIFSVMALWEIRTPKKALTQSKHMRWWHNLSLVGFNSIALPIVLPILAIDTALWAEQHAFGLFHFAGFNELGFFIKFIVSLLILDAFIYWQHRIFHRIPWLWRLHRVHHADQDIDVTTGSRFHTLEIILSMLIKCAIVAILGISWQAVLVFEILLNGCAMFNHANISLTKKRDHKLRRLIVTPDMHRVHHSSLHPEMHRNFGFCLSIWDRLFHSYQAQPQSGHQQMQIGLPYFRQLKEQKLLAMLTQPFRSKTK